MLAKLTTALLLAKLIAAQPGPPSPPGQPGPRGANDNCHVLPGDAAWPKDDSWAKLNSTVSGKLVKTVPIGSPCHDPTYDETACNALKAQWTNPLTQ